MTLYPLRTFSLLCCLFLLAFPAFSQAQGSDSRGSTNGGTVTEKSAAQADQLAPGQYRGERQWGGERKFKKAHGRSMILCLAIVISTLSLVGIFIVNLLQLLDSRKRHAYTGSVAHDPPVKHSASQETTTKDPQQSDPEEDTKEKQ
jgi:hypothetical protein